MRNKFTITLEALPEHRTPKQAEKQENYVEGFADAVNANRTKNKTWGWCTIRLTVTDGKKAGTAYLGECSYESPQDFIKNSEYFESLVHDAIANME